MEVVVRTTVPTLRDHSYALVVKAIPLLMMASNVLVSLKVFLSIVFVELCFMLIVIRYKRVPS